MPKIMSLTAALLITSAVAFAPAALAAGEGQIEGGDIYRIKNITKNTDFTDPASADACDELMYKVRVHNLGQSAVTNTNVKVTLSSTSATSHSSAVLISGSNMQPPTTSDTAVVNLSSSQSLSYVSGSTQLLGANNEFLQNLPDGITGSGVNIGSVGVSIEQKRFVQFKVKVSCPQPVPQPPPAPQVRAKVSELPVTGPASAVGLFAGVSALAGVGHYLYRRFVS